MPSDQAFNLFGFPTRIRPGFVLFLLLVVVLYGGSLGIWIAGSIAVFTVIHELGHAFAAKMTGATAEISLDFLAGYTSYLPSRPLRPYERAGIALAGPLAQLLTSIGVLLAMGTSPFSRGDILSNEASVAVWWAGVALALVNLFPALPLDRGYIVASLIDIVAPNRGRIVMVPISIGLTLAAMVIVAFNSDWSSFLPFFIFLLIIQLQMRRSVAMANDEELAHLMLEQLPRPLPLGEPAVQVSICRALLLAGQNRECVDYAARAFNNLPLDSSALYVAEGLLRLGDSKNAAAWLQTAFSASLDLRQLRNHMGQLPNVSKLAHDPAIAAQLRAAMEARR